MDSSTILGRGLWPASSCVLAAATVMQIHSHEYFLTSVVVD